MSYTICGLAILGSACSTATPEAAETVEADSLEQFGHTFETASTFPTPATNDPLRSPSISVAYIDPLDLPVDEDISISGSSHLYPLMERLGSAFTSDGFGGRINLSQTLTDRSFEDHCTDGGIDILLAGRQPTVTEAETCEALGRPLTTLTIGSDRIAVVVNDQNYWLLNLASADIALVLNGSAWDEIDPAFSDRQLVKLLPTAAHDMWSTVQQHLQSPNTDSLEVEAIDAEFFDRDGEVVSTLLRNRDGVALVPLSAYARSEQVGLRLVSIDNLDPLLSARYPIEQDIVVAFEQGSLLDKPWVATFLAFVLNRLHLDMPDVGLSPLPTEDADAMLIEFTSLIEQDDGVAVLLDDADPNGDGG